MNPSPSLLTVAMKTPRFARFLVVGVLNTAFSYSIYALGVFLGLPYQVANLASLVAGIFFSFGTQKAWVFTGARDASFWRFTGIWAVLYLLNIGLIRIGIDFGLNEYFAGAAALPFIVVASYVLQGRYSFRTRS
jgi:putative flippase GtrA